MSNYYDSSNRRSFQKERESIEKMSQAERRKKLYKCGDKYTEWKMISTWPRYYKMNKSEIDKEIASPDFLKRELQGSIYTNDVKLNEQISVFTGDITTLEVDAIINAANSSLLGGGGVDGAIHRAAGPYLVDECRPLRGCDVGDAKITSGYNLPARFVIHTVGPMGEKPSLLESCYKTSLSLAVANNCRTVAFPCISTGIYGYPNEAATHVVLPTVRTFLETHPNAFDRVIFVLFMPVDIRVYHRYLPVFFPIHADQGSDGARRDQKEEHNSDNRTEERDKKEKHGSKSRKHGDSVEPPGKEPRRDESHGSAYKNLSTDIQVTEERDKKEKHGSKSRKHSDSMEQPGKEPRLDESHGSANKNLSTDIQVTEEHDQEEKHGSKSRKHGDSVEQPGKEPRRDESHGSANKNLSTDIQVTEDDKIKVLVENEAVGTKSNRYGSTNVHEGSSHEERTEDIRSHEGDQKDGSKKAVEKLRKSIDESAEGISNEGTEEGKKFEEDREGKNCERFEVETNIEDDGNVESNEVVEKEERKSETNNQKIECDSENEKREVSGQQGIDSKKERNANRRQSNSAEDRMKKDHIEDNDNSTNQLTDTGKSDQLANQNFSDMKSHPDVDSAANVVRDVYKKSSPSPKSKV